MKRALFIIGSPFQALCALEAKKQYSIDNAVFALFENAISKNMIVPLIKDHGEIIMIKNERKGTIPLIRSIRKNIKEKFSQIFIGDYFSYGEFVVAVCSIKMNTLFIYLDDGNSTLAIVPPISRKKYRSKHERYWYFLFNLYNKIMQVKSRLFTIYDIGQNCPIPVEKNTFSALVGEGSAHKEGVFVIGTNADTLVFKDKNYLDYLVSLNDWINRNHNNSVIYYCPHRSDKTNSKVFVASLGWKVFGTKISVEVDFVNEGIYPVCVVGFGSTALLTLKKIFPLSDVHTIVMNFKDDSFNRTYREIESYYSKCGIASVNI